MWKPDYAELLAVKDFLRIDADDTSDDAHITHAITAASRAVDRHCRRQFGLVDDPELRLYTAEWHRRGALVVVDDLMDLTGISVQVSGVDVVPERWWPVNAPQDGAPWTRVYLPRGTSCSPDAVGITAPWGWSSFPATVVEATTLQSTRFVKRRDAAFGVAGSPEIGSELRLLAKVDPDVAVMLADYVRRGRVA